MSARIWRLDGGREYLVVGRQRAVAVSEFPFEMRGDAAGFAHKLRLLAQAIEDAIEEADGPRGGVTREIAEGVS